MDFDPKSSEPRRKRFRAIPVRLLLPNMITLLSLCAGLTAIRLALEGKIEWALGAIVFAAALDGIDGRVARLLKGQSKFGAELDSLADFVNFGVVPGLILYFWGLNELGAIGWIAALVFAICMSLRLARFNVMAEDPSRPVWMSNFFTGVPAPAGAIIVLLPIYLALLGFPRVPALACVYTLAMAFLLVSTLPVFSGKKLGTRVPREMVLPVFVAVVLFVALLVSYPWHVLSIGSILYIAALPLGWLSYRGYAQKDAAAAQAASAPAPERGGGISPRRHDREAFRGGRAAGSAELNVQPPMSRAIARLNAGEAGSRPVRDTLLLDHSERKSPVGMVAGLRGNRIEFALPPGTALVHDDLLLLDDGSVVEIVARPEPLIEIRAADSASLARAAWLLGDHHIPAELSERRLRVRRGDAIAPLLAPLGVKLAEIEAPFEPEGGAYHHGS